MGKSPDHKQEFSHPGDLDWPSASMPPLPPPQDIQPESEMATDIPTAAHEPDAVENRGLLGAAGGAAAAWGGMKVTGADQKIGFLGKAGLIVGAAVAGHLLQEQMSGGKKSNKDKKGKKDKKDKKHKKHKSRGLEVGERSLSQEDSDSDSSSCDEEFVHGMNPPAVHSACPRPRCEFGDKCFRKNPDHKKQFSHPDDADWSASAGS